MQRERLLVVIESMEVGGSQRQIQHLLAALDRERWEPELAYFRDDSALLDAIRATGIPVHLVPKRRRVDLRFLLAFATLLRRRDYAVVHAFSLTAELWSVLACIASGRRSRLVASERSFKPATSTWHWRLKRLVLRGSAAVIANSTAGARATAALGGVPETRIATIGNAVEIPTPMPPDVRQQLRATLGVPDGRVFAVFVGRLVEVKNLPCLLRALALMDPAHRPWLALVGDGPCRAVLGECIDALELSGDACLLGERDDVSRLLQAADFLVLPSFFEGLSNALLEAMAAGCPVVASATGGTPELVETGVTGLLFPGDDAVALAHCMARLVESPTLRATLGASGRRHVAGRHGRATLAAETAAVYERCLAAPVREDARSLLHTTALGRNAE